MIAQHWHEIVVMCPSCKRRVRVAHFFFSADGELRVQGTCAKCSSGVALDCYASNLQHKAFVNDLAAASAPPSTALAVPMRPDLLATDDREFLRKNGIMTEPPPREDDGA